MGSAPSQNLFGRASRQKDLAQLIRIASKSTVTQTSNPPIFDAVSAGDLDRIKALYAHDPTVANQKDALGAGPLKSAAFFGNADIVRILLDNGARTGFKDKFGMTALATATKAGHTEVARLLRQGNRI
jgi:ankyrin repeat protein